ncbi:Protein tesmin/TSO1-like CXC [Arachis hypogaea]|nr:Protein tesmin/TSO1-like CXC [Arachis hypogaea]
MLTKSVIPAACFKATEESHPTSSATAVAATKIHLKIGCSSQEEISLGFMSLCVSLILGNNKLGGNFSGRPVFSVSPSIMWCSSYYQSQKLERPVEHSLSRMTQTKFQHYHTTREDVTVRNHSAKRNTVNAFSMFCFSKAGVGCSINCRCDTCKNTFGRKNGSNSVGIETQPEVEIEACGKEFVENASRKIDI